MLRTLLPFLLLSTMRAGTSSAQPGSLVWAGATRTYTKRIPSSYDGLTPVPLVIVMHGGLGSAANVENQSGMTTKAEAEGFIVVYPDGLPGGALNIRTWNAGWCCGPSANNNVDDVGFLNALLDTLIAQHAIDTTRIYATGMSNGGFMAYRLACELAHRIAAIAPVAASMSMPVCQPSRPVPVCAIHSYLDQNVPYTGGVGSGLSNHYNNPQDSVLNAWAAHGACTVLNDTLIDDATLTLIEWRDCDCGAVMRLYLTKDGGHSWPGGQPGSAFGDPPSTAISANDEMWAFFQQHTLECAATTALDTGARPPVPIIHPNPANDRLDVIAQGIRWVGMLDASGRLMMERHSTPQDRLTLDVSTFAPGAYFLRIRQDGHRIRTIRVVLRR